MEPRTKALSPEPDPVRYHRSRGHGRPGGRGPQGAKTNATLGQFAEKRMEVGAKAAPFLHHGRDQSMTRRDRSGRISVSREFLSLLAGGSMTRGAGASAGGRISEDSHYRPIYN